MNSSQITMIGLSLMTTILLSACSKKPEASTTTSQDEIAASAKLEWEEKQRQERELEAKETPEQRSQRVAEIAKVDREWARKFTPSTNRSTDVGISSLTSSENYIELPAVEKRKVLGNWLTPSFGLKGVPCAFSLETTGAKTYEVARCANGEGGKGRLVKRLGGGRYVIPGLADGTWVQITPSGDLSVRDSQGEINRIAKYPDLWPPMSAEGRLITLSTPNSSTTVENSKTIDLSCSEVGYRYGFVAGLAMLGKQGRPDWDFVVPPRCQQDAGYGEALKRGLVAASRD